MQNSAILHRKTASSGISNLIGKRADLFDYLPLDSYRFEILSREIARFPRGRVRRAKGSVRRGEPPVLMFTIYHGTPDCLPDDKGSCVARAPSLLPSPLYGEPFLFCGNACVPAHNFQMSCGLYRADTCPTYGLVIIGTSYLVPLPIFSK